VTLTASSLFAVGCTAHGARHASAGVREVSVHVGRFGLPGTLTLPTQKGRAPAVVLLSGSGPNDQDESIGPNKPFKELADSLARSGVASIRYDKRTRDAARSLDPQTFTAQDEYVPDAVAAVALLQRRAEIDSQHIVILGHSQGGTFAPAIAARLHQVAGVILMAAATEPVERALLRQTKYLASLPGQVGSRAAAQLPAVEALVAQLESADLAHLPASTPMPFGTGPAYWLSLRSYDPVTTARRLRQPLLVLQGGRDYNVTVADDFVVWKRGLAGKAGTTTKLYPAADHLFFDGRGKATPGQDMQPHHLDPALATDIASWIHGLAH
jgi:dienelactone hydrolase